MKEKKEISIRYKNKKYSYTRVGEDFTWINEKNIILPLADQQELKLEAISQGHNSSIFVKNKEIEASKEVSWDEELPKKGRKPRALKSSTVKINVSLDDEQIGE